MPVQGRSMPEKPTHSASFQGSIFKFEIQASKPQNTRFKITCHGHMYIGQVRHMVASKLLFEPENMRLFTNGAKATSLHQQTACIIEITHTYILQSLYCSA